MLQEEVQALKEIVQSTKMYSTAINRAEVQDKKSANMQRELYEVCALSNEYLLLSISILSA